jgi:6-methylsalicylate decarboxylase
VGHRPRRGVDLLARCALRQRPRRGRAGPALLHPTSPTGHENVDLGLPRPLLEFLFDTARTVTSLLVAGAFDRYPHIRWIVPHGGGVLPLLADRLELFRPLLPGSGSAAVSTTLARLWYDTAGTPFPRQLPVLAALVGDTQIVYGSDSCWTPPAQVDRQLASIDAVWRQSLTANAAGLTMT